MEQNVLSKKRYAVARLINYLCLIFVIVLVFLPIWTIQEKESGVIMEVSVSTLQLLIDDAEAPVTLKTEDGEEVEGFLGALASMTEWDVIDAMYADDANLYNTIRITIVAGTILCGVLIWGIRKIQRKSYKKSSQKKSKASYIRSVYEELPDALFAIEFSILMMIVLVYAILFRDGYTPTYFWLIYVFPVLIVADVHWRVICAKDVRLIKETNVMIDEKYVHPTVKSDMQAIGSLFSSEKATIAAAVDHSIEQSNP